MKYLFFLMTICMIYTNLQGTDPVLIPLDPLPKKHQQTLLEYMYKNFGPETKRSFDQRVLGSEHIILYMLDEEKEKPITLPITAFLDWQTPLFFGTKKHRATRYLSLAVIQKLYQKNTVTVSSRTKQE